MHRTRHCWCPNSATVGECLMPGEAVMTQVPSHGSQWSIARSLNVDKRGNVKCHMPNVAVEPFGIPGTLRLHRLHQHQAIYLHVSSIYIP